MSTGGADGGGDAADGQVVRELVKFQKTRIQQLTREKKELVARVKAAEALGQEIESCLKYASDLRCQIAAEEEAERSLSVSALEDEVEVSLDLSPVKAPSEDVSPHRRDADESSLALQDTSQTVHNAIGELEDIISTIEQKEGTMARIWDRIFAIQKAIRANGAATGSPRRHRRGSGDAVQALAALEHEVLDALKAARLSAAAENDGQRHLHRTEHDDSVSSFTVISQVSFLHSILEHAATKGFLTEFPRHLLWSARFLVCRRGSCQPISSSLGICFRSCAKFVSKRNQAASQLSRPNANVSRIKVRSLTVVVQIQMCPRPRFLTYAHFWGM